MLVESGGIPAASSCIPYRLGCKRAGWVIYNHVVSHGLPVLPWMHHDPYSRQARTLHRDRYPQIAIVLLASSIISVGKFSSRTAADTALIHISPAASLLMDCSFAHVTEAPEMG